MSKYTTGEIAKLCGVSVRTVQYYDSRNILIPSELSEGGRRLYSEQDLKRMKIICFLRDAGISINSIGELLSEDNPGSIIQWTSIIMWIATGIWWPIIVWALLAIPYGIWVSNFYFKRVAYICPRCHEVFKPNFKEAFWARHTPTLRKLTCTCCGYHGFCVETYGKEEKKNG